MLYFAYGSNLNHFQMKRRCKDSIFLKKYELKGFRLNFRSKYRAADIEKKNNSKGYFLKSEQHFSTSDVQKHEPYWALKSTHRYDYENRSLYR